MQKYDYTLGSTLHAERSNADAAISAAGTIAHTGTTARMSGIARIGKVALVGAMVAGTVVSSCSKDDDGAPSSVTIAVSNVQDLGSVSADKLQVTANGKVLTSATFANGAATLTLPATVGDEFLTAVTAEMSSDAKVDPADTKGASISLDLYKGTTLVGEIEPEGTAGGVPYMHVWMYVDKNVSVTGDISMSLKKGWNVVYINTKTYAASTTQPAGYTLTWDFDAESE
jgi:hypothetical protein